jgi:23S rRNA (guanine745-N1)-methyltransferase
VNDSALNSLACSVRECGLPLARHERSYVCAAGHSFDVARSGYVNLLQPQDRRSLNAGDSKSAVEARAALDRVGFGHAVVNAVINRIGTLQLHPDAVAVDLGCGSGEMLERLCRDRSMCGIGIDLSVAAIDSAARRCPGLTWIVANADRRLPLRDNDTDVVLSIYGRRNPAECARVLTSTGFLIVALPAADDLIELRQFVQGRGVERDRADGMLRDHDMDFQLIERVAIRERVTVERNVLLNLLRGTYRGARFKWSDRVAATQQMEVTSSSELCVLKRKGSG